MDTVHVIPTNQRGVNFVSAAMMVERLRPFREQGEVPNEVWDYWVKLLYGDRV